MVEVANENQLDVASLEQDGDLAPLRSDPRWKILIEKIRGSK